MHLDERGLAYVHILFSSSDFLFLVVWLKNLVGLFIYSFIHSFNSDLLSSYYIAGEIPDSHRTYILGKEDRYLSNKTKKQI